MEDKPDPYSFHSVYPVSMLWNVFWERQNFCKVLGEESLDESAQKEQSRHHVQYISTNFSEGMADKFQTSLNGDNMNITKCICQELAYIWFFIFFFSVVWRWYYFKT